MTYMVYVLWFTTDLIPKSVYWEGSVLCTVVLSGAWVFLALQYFWCVKVVSGMRSIIRASGGQISPTKLAQATGKVDKPHNA